MMLLALLLSATQPTLCTDAPYGTSAGQTKPFLCSLAREPSTKDPLGGPSLVWPSKKATFKINSRGTLDIPTDQDISDGVSETVEFTIVRQAFNTWTVPSCTDLRFTDGGLTASERVGFDFRRLDENENVVVFQDSWSHDSMVIGLTTATFNSQTGEIFDADIELNDEQYDFSYKNTNVQTDLLNTVTHEVGHFIGFEHPDKPGSTLPSQCASNATMSRTSTIGETAKRTLAPTDEMGLCFVYPSGGAVRYCVAPSGTQAPAPVIRQIGASLDDGCSQTSAGSSALVALACLLVLVQRRRE